MEIYEITYGHALWNDVISYADNCSWRAGKNLASLMRENKFQGWERVFAACEKGCIVGFCTLTEKDCLPPESPFTPLIGFVFVDKAHRGNRISEEMIRRAVMYARIIGYSKVYLTSSENGLYEKYGFVSNGECNTIYGTKEHLFVISSDL